MPSNSAAKNNRRGSRQKAVLALRLKGKDKSGTAFEDLVHTLDVTPAGVRVGGVRRELNLLDEITVFYRQRKLQFRVMWIKKLKGTSEFQVGLKSLMQEGEAWGASSPQYGVQAAQGPEILRAPGIV
jgi:hypothetical protein